MRSKSNTPAQMLDGLKIRWRLHQDETEPTTRYRGMNVYKKLHEWGIDADRWTGEKCDIIILQYTMNKLNEALAASPVVISDVNDKVFDANHPNRNEMLAGFQRVDAITAGSIRLEEHLKKYHRFVRMIDDAIDPQYFEVKKEKHDGINLIWTGMHCNINFWAEIDPVLEELSKKYDFTVNFITSKIDGSGNSNIEKVKNKPYHAKWHNWSIDTLLNQMKIADIAVVPLFQNDWSFAKSSNKVLTFAAAGIPVVATDVPSYRRIINNGINGCLCYTMEDWESNLTDLLTDADLRVRMGLAGKTTAKDFKVDRIAMDWINVFREIRKS